MILAFPDAASAQCLFQDNGYRLDWNQPYATWQNEDISRTVAVPAINGPGNADVNFTFTGATNFFQPTYPQTSSLVTGGQGASNESLLFLVDLASNQQRVSLTITFPEPVEDLEFDIYDIDNLDNGFRDSIFITAQNTTNGTSPAPDLSTPYHSNANQFPSHVFIENILGPRRLAGVRGNSDLTEDLGNATVAFSQPVDRVSIEYGTWLFFNSNNPIQQGIAIHDLDFCIPAPPEADITATKSQSLHSEISTNCAAIPGKPDPQAEFAIPGACMEYTISASNTGPGDARDLRISDQLDSNLIYRSAMFSGFTNDGPSFGLSTPAPGQDCAGGSCVILLEDARLAPGETGKIVIRTTVK